MKKIISLTTDQINAIQHITNQALREKQQPQFDETQRVGKKSNSILLATSVSTTLPNTASNETGIHSIVDTIFIHLGQEKLSRILETPKLLERLFTRWHIALGQSIDAADKSASKQSLQEKFLEAINKKVEDHLFATCKSDKDLATKALNWANVLSSDKIKLPDLKTNFLHAVSYRYLNEKHLQTTTPNTDRAIKFIEQVSKSSPEILKTHINDININEKLQGVLYQQAFLIPNSDKSSFKKFEKLIENLKQKKFIEADKLDQFKVLIEMRYELAHHGHRKGIFVDKTNQIAQLLHKLTIQKDVGHDEKLWKLCLEYEPRYETPEKARQENTQDFRQINFLPRIQLRDLILATQVAQGFKSGKLTVGQISTRQAAAFYNFCNSTYFGSLYLNLIPGLAPRTTEDGNSAYKNALESFKGKYFTDEAPNDELKAATEIPIFFNGQFQFFNALTQQETKFELTQENVKKIQDSQLRNEMSSQLLISKIQTAKTEKSGNQSPAQSALQPDTGQNQVVLRKKTQKQELHKFRESIYVAFETEDNPEVISKTLQKFEELQKQTPDNRRSEAPSGFYLADPNRPDSIFGFPASTNKSESDPAKSTLSITSTPPGITAFSPAQLTVIIKELQARLKICEDKLSKFDKALLSQETQLKEVKDRLKAVESELPILEIPPTLNNHENFFKNLSAQLKTDLDIATSGYLNSIYTKNPSTLSQGLDAIGTVGDIFFGFGSIATTLVKAVTEKVEEHFDGQKIKTLLQARAALDVSNAGLANIIVTALMNGMSTLANLNLDTTFISELSENILKHLKSNPTDKEKQDIKFDQENSKIEFSEKYITKLRDRISKHSQQNKSKTK